MAAALRFVEISKEILDNLPDNSIPEKTKKATKYGIKIFNGKLCCCCCFFLLDKTTNFFYKFKTNQALLFSISLFNILLLFFIEWFASQTKFKTAILEKEELNECLTMFYAALRREDGTEFEVSSLKAIRAAIDR